MQWCMSEMRSVQGKELGLARPSGGSKLLIISPPDTTPHESPQHLAEAASAPRHSTRLVTLHDMVHF